MATCCRSQGPPPRVDRRMDWRSRLGALRVRLGIGRMRYSVRPGLYAAGSPIPDSPVLVSANYRLSFDVLRSSLGEVDAWILVLDTKGINVWCAAGKGTFGTAELVHRIGETGLEKRVSHRRVVVPQLGAVGVSAHEVRERSGFSVTFGPVRAEDIPAFLGAKMKTTPEMRRVRFRLVDRALVMPMEFTGGLKKLLWIMLGVAALSGFGPGGYSVERAVADGMVAVLLLLGSYLAGTVLVPLLLPWLPGRAFSVKGASLGLLLAAGLFAYAWRHPGAIGSWLEVVAWALFVPALVSFIAMNFTGASTYTSLSGVRREMRIAVPAQIACTVVAVGLAAVGKFV